MLFKHRRSLGKHNWHTAHLVRPVTSPRRLRGVFVTNRSLRPTESVRHTVAPRKGLKRRPFLGLLPGFAVPPAFLLHRNLKHAHYPLVPRLPRYGFGWAALASFHRQGPVHHRRPLPAKTLTSSYCFRSSTNRPRENQILGSEAQRFSLRLLFLPRIRFTAKSSAPLGSSCQSRLCSSARRLNPKPRRACFRALRLRSAPEIDSASLRLFPCYL